MLENPKLSLDIGLITIKANIELSGKETEKYIPETLLQSLLFVFVFVVFSTSSAWKR